MVKKTLLLVFIHGFKGSDGTFAHFPEDLRALISHALPKINVVSIVYPRYETRGDLRECVAKFKEWLQNRVIDLEVAAKAPAPTIDPSVHVVLIGHSMGGIVAAETLISIANDQPVPPRPTSSSTPPPGVGNNTTDASPAPNTTHANLSVPEPPPRSSSAPPESESSSAKRSAANQTNTDTSTTPNSPGEESDSSDDNPTFLFPHIQALLSFDTPYLGIHPGVVAHNAETYYNTGSAAWNAYTQAQKLFGSASTSAATAASASSAAKSLPPPPSAGSSWGKWALYAGGAAAVAAAGSVAWKKREELSTGWTWAFSHLEFVGCLARGAELTDRVERVVKLGRRHSVGFADFYTALGEGISKETYYAGQVLGEERTFCVVPKELIKTKMKNTGKGRDKPSPSKRRKVVDAKEGYAGEKKGTWVKCVNEKAKTEIGAHTSMFLPQENPGYFGTNERAKEMVLGWVDKGWYEESVEEDEGVEEGTEGLEVEEDMEEVAEAELEEDIEERAEAMDADVEDAEAMDTETEAKDTEAEDIDAMDTDVKDDKVKDRETTA